MTSFFYPSYVWLFHYFTYDNFFLEDKQRPGAFAWNLPDFTYIYWCTLLLAIKYFVELSVWLSSSEDEEEEEDNDKENVYPGIQKNDINTHQQPRRTLASDSCPDAAVLKDFLDVEAEEEDDSDDDMARFKDNEEDDGDDENEVLTALIAAGFEEEEVDHEKRNALHQKWLQDQDAAETNNFIQRLKYGHQEQKVLMEEDEDDIEDCEDESENERSHDLTPNIVRQNSEKAKQMIAKMFTDENDTYEHSDDEEIEEHLARQRISKREVSADTFEYCVFSYA